MKSWLISSKEKCPKTQRLHVQGACYFPTPRSFSATKARFPKGTHLEVMNGTCAENRVYCSKPDTRVDGEDALAFESGTVMTVYDVIFSTTYF